MIPVNANAHQMLQVIRKDAAGDIAIEDVLPVAFVPLVKGDQRG